MTSNKNSLSKSAEELFDTLDTHTYSFCGDDREEFAYHYKKNFKAFKEEVAHLLSDEELANEKLVCDLAEFFSKNS